MIILCFLAVGQWIITAMIYSYIGLLIGTILYNPPAGLFLLFQTLRLFLLFETLRLFWV